jgi:hypothetical protein
MRASIVLSVAAVLTAAALAPFGPALARGPGSHGHSGPPASAAPKSASPYRILPILPPKPGKPGVGLSKEHPDHRHRHRHRPAIDVITPYDPGQTCVQILPSGRRVRVRCSPEAFW